MRILTSVLILSSLSACGGSDSGIGSNDSILGTWRSNCFAYFQQYKQNVYIFDEKTYTLDSTTYSDINCSNPTSNGEFYNGDYTVGVKLNASDGAEATRITMVRKDTLHAERASFSVKSAFRITGSELYFGSYHENKVTEINPYIVYLKESNDRQANCTAEFVSGIRISTIDASTELSNACGVTVIVKDGDYLDEAENEDGLGCNDEFVFNLAGERSGEYDIIVQKDGFNTWHENGVIVTSNRCHVNTVSITAELTRND